MPQGVSFKRLHEVLAYDPRTGVFRWLINRPKGKHLAAIGSIAGTIDGKGYRTIFLDGRSHKATHLAWLYMTGEWPTRWIDHKNRVRDDNVFENLRQATPQQNAANSPGWSRQNHGLKGVYPQKKSTQNPWFSAIRVNRKLLYLGSFATPEEAHAAYLAAAEKHFGEFARAGHEDDPPVKKMPPICVP